MNALKLKEISGKYSNYFSFFNLLQKDINKWSKRV
jgi:hypothetical protein